MLGYSKAFDTLNHVLLLSKLKFFGFSHNALKFMTSYFNERKQKVIVDQDVESDLKVLEAGVPQGSILGPL